MRFVQKYKRIPDKPNGPFSDENLEQAFRVEDETQYSDTDKVDGQIPHRSVIYILHDMFEKHKTEKAEKKQRKASLNQARAEVAALRQQQQEDEEHYDYAG